MRAEAWAELATWCSIGLLLWASLHDLLARTVPNGVAAALAASSLLSRLAGGALLGPLLAGLIVFALAAFCWRRGWLGGADAKLLGAAALGLTPATVPAFLCAVAIAGGVLALFYLVARPLMPRPAALRPAGLLRRALRAECWRIRRGGPLPYACAIAAGSLLVLR
jgi:prepilin peptidase CpaA